MFLADRYIKGECPVCGTKDQYGDACENCSSVYSPTQLINPYSTLSGAKPELRSSDHLFFKLSDEKCVDFLREWLEQPGRLQSQVVNKAWSGSTRKATRRSGTGTSRATRPTSAFPFRHAREILLRLARRADRLPGEPGELLREKAPVVPDFVRPDSDAEMIHFIGKDIIYFHTCSGQRC